MGTTSLENYQALNEQLAALVEAGVPIDTGLMPTGGSAAATLERIQSTVARRVGRGESLEEALQGDDQEVPSGYRSLVQLGLHGGGNLAAGFDGASRSARSADRTRYAFESALIYPLVVCVIAYAGLISMCMFFVPTLEEMYVSLRLTPGPGLRVLQLVRDAMPYWVVLLPLLLVLLVAWRIRAGWRRRTTGTATSGLAGWLPGVSKTMFQEHCAHFAEALAELLHDGVPVGEALGLAADSSGAARLREMVARLSTALDDGQLPSDGSPTAQRFPPFLRWAIWQAESTTGRVRALEIAARVYRSAAQRRGQRLRTLAPLVATALFGGTFTLLYGLALFVPMVELLEALAK
jgi:general secretion pathway protein F